MPDHDGLNSVQLETYFALTEAAGLLQQAVERQLRAHGGLSYIQFHILARLDASEKPLTMTELADGVVYSRSGLTYQAGLLDQAGLIKRKSSPQDERATLVTITAAGRRRLRRVMPGHIEVAKTLLFDGLSDADVRTLGDIMSRVRDHIHQTSVRQSSRRRTTQ